MSNLFRSHIAYGLCTGRYTRNWIINFLIAFALLRHQSQCHTSLAVALKWVSNIPWHDSKWALNIGIRKHIFAWGFTLKNYLTFLIHHKWSNCPIVKSQKKKKKKNPLIGLARSIRFIHLHYLKLPRVFGVLFSPFWNKYLCFTYWRLCCANVSCFFICHRSDPHFQFCVLFSPFWNKVCVLPIFDH